MRNRSYLKNTESSFVNSASMISRNARCPQYRLININDAVECQNSITLNDWDARHMFVAVTVISQLEWIS